MSDFIGGFWGLYIAVITAVSLFGCALLLKTFTTRKLSPGEKVDTTGHVWDEDLKEWNHPLPNWWRWLFWLTLVFAVVYLALYPGLGGFQGVLGWSQAKQYDDELAQANAQYGPLFEKFARQDIKAVAASPEGREIGQRLFLTYCASCHGSDAKGGRGFPNLTDKDWLYGGEPETIETTIRDGRMGMMPPMGAAVGSDEDVKDLAHYVRSLSGLAHDSLRAQRGQVKFAAICAACHGADAKGNRQLHAPNLTDGIWLYGSSESTVIETITKGRTGQMPAFRDFLGDAKVHLLAAYVWSLSNEPGATPAALPRQ